MKPTVDDVIQVYFEALKPSPAEVQAMIDRWPVLADAAKAARRPEPQSVYDASSWDGYRGCGSAVAVIAGEEIVEAVYFTGIDQEIEIRRRIRKKHPSGSILAGMMSCHEFVVYPGQEAPKQKRKNDDV